MLLEHITTQSVPKFRTTLSRRYVNINGGFYKATVFGQNADGRYFARVDNILVYDWFDKVYTQSEVYSIIYKYGIFDFGR